MKTYPASMNEFDKRSKKLKIPLQMDPKYRDIGAKTKLGARRVELKSTNTTGQTKYYGFRSFITKEDAPIEPQKQPILGLQTLMNTPIVEKSEPVKTRKIRENKPEDITLSMLKNVLSEQEDMTSYPVDIINNIKSLMRKGVNPGKKDLEAYQQSTGSTEIPQWKNALELIDTAFHNAGLPKPKIDTQAWKQYLELIPYAVKLMADKYGLHGDNAKWRITQPIVVESDQVNERIERDALLKMLLPKEQKEPSEQQRPQSLNDIEVPDDYEPGHIGKKRFFVSIAGAGETEVEGKNIHEIIEQITNKMRRHGVKVRTEQQSPEGAILTFWYNDVKREQIKIRQVG